MKLSPNEITDIFLTPEKTSILAAIYGVSESTIRSIKRRRSHTAITDSLLQLAGKPKSTRHILDNETVLGIYKFTGTINSLKRVFGVSKAVANNIKFGYTYKSVTEHIEELPGELKVHSLSWDDVCTIRVSSVPSDLLASLFGISRGTVNNIRSGRTRQLK